MPNSRTRPRFPRNHSTGFVQTGTWFLVLRASCDTPLSLCPTPSIITCGGGTASTGDGGVRSFQSGVSHCNPLFPSPVVCLFPISDGVNDCIQMQRLSRLGSSWPSFRFFPPCSDRINDVGSSRMAAQDDLDATSTLPPPRVLPLFQADAHPHFLSRMQGIPFEALRDTPSFSILSCVVPYHPLGFYAA